MTLAFCLMFGTAVALTRLAMQAIDHHRRLLRYAVASERRRLRYGRVIDRQRRTIGWQARDIDGLKADVARLENGQRVTR